MQLSVTFDEQILKTLSVDEWLEFCLVHQVKSLEFSPEPSVLTFEDYKTLLNKQQSAGLGVTFHVPYFAKKYNSQARAYDFSYFREEKKAFIKQYDILFEYLYMANQTSKLTFHGATYQKPFDKNASLSARDTTWFAIDYLLNKIQKKGLPITLCAEMSGPESNSYLTKRLELVETIEKFNTDHLKICWDITHDFGVNSQLAPLDTLFKKHIDHIHIHGINKEGTKHISLENSLLSDDLITQTLTDIGFKNTVVLELLTHTIGNHQEYLKTLGNDLDRLSKKL